MMTAQAMLPLCFLSAACFSGVKLLGRRAGIEQQDGLERRRKYTRPHNKISNVVELR